MGFELKALYTIRFCFGSAMGFNAKFAKDAKGIFAFPFDLLVVIAVKAETV